MSWVALLVEDAYRRALSGYVRAQLVDTESEPGEAPSEAEELQSLGSRVPLMGEEFETFEPTCTITDSSHSSASSNFTSPLSPDHQLTRVSPTPTPIRTSFHYKTACIIVHAQPAMSLGILASVAEAMALSDSAFRKSYRSSYETPSPSLTLLVRKRYRGTSELILDTYSDEDELGDEDGEDESLDADDERERLDDEGPSLDDDSRGLEYERLSLEEDEKFVPEGVMFIPAYVDSKTITQADGVQRFRVLVPLPDDRYVAVRQAQLVDTESEPEEAPSEAEELHSLASSDFTAPLSLDNPLNHVSPTLTPTCASFHHKTARMTMRAQPAMSLGISASVKRQCPYDEGYRLDDEIRSLQCEGLGLEEEEEFVPEGQQHVVLVVDTATDGPLRLGYGALRRHELAVEEDQVPSTFEVGQSSRSVTEQQGAERVSAFRLPTQGTWVDLEDGRVYTDILAYTPRVASVQTPPSLEWSSDSLPISPSSTVVSLLIASLVATMRDIRVLYTRSRMVKDEIFSQRACFTRMEDMSWAGYDEHRLIHDMLVHKAALQRELQDIRGRVTALEQERDHREQ
ncbi:hypothetical protein Tco_0033939 [Tanacetum coccineum]